MFINDDELIKLNIVFSKHREVLKMKLVINIYYFSGVVNFAVNDSVTSIDYFLIHHNPLHCIKKSRP